jgi:hypothetical protein
MTLFFLASGEEPVFAQHQHADWQKCLADLSARQCRQWKSLPVRFGRLIANCTCQRQSERWDMSQIVGELERLTQAEAHPSAVESAELWAEEALALAVGPATWDWDFGKITATSALPSGVAVRVAGDEVDRSIKLEMTWDSSGTEERRRVQKWMAPACERAVAALKAGDWHAAAYSEWGSSFTVHAAVQVARLNQNCGRAIAALSKALRSLKFD